MRPPARLRTLRPPLRLPAHPRKSNTAGTNLHNVGSSRFRWASHNFLLVPPAIANGQLVASRLVSSAPWGGRSCRLPGRPPPAPEVRGKTVILIDDGLATGATMLTAAKALRQKNPAEIIVAAPVAAPEVCDEFRSQVDRIVCAVTPEPFYGVGHWYEDFSQTTDEEVRDLLERAARQRVS